MTIGCSSASAAMGALIYASARLGFMTDELVELGGAVV